MRIGLLTYHSVYNFGANLQALSTYSYLKRMGHNPIVIDFFPEGLEQAFSRSVPGKQADAHKDFVKRCFELTPRCRNSRHVADAIKSENIQVVIIGSDAVLQHFPLLARTKIIPSKKTLVSVRVQAIRYETNFPNPFWGEFIQYTGDIPVSMMSVSCQDTQYELIAGTMKKEMKCILEKMKYISVRDDRTKNLIKHLTSNKCSPSVTPDPVFAFNENYEDQYDRETILQKFGLPEKYILLSFNSGKTVDRDWVKSFTKDAGRKGYACVALTMPGGIKFESDLVLKAEIPLDPLEWYSLIKYSGGYVGEKMHPLIVALHNNVPIFSFDHYGVLKFKLFLNQESSKINHILGRSGFLDHRVSIARKLTYKAPDPSFVFSKLMQFDKDKCNAFALQMKTDYYQMMDDLLTSLKI